MVVDTPLQPVRAEDVVLRLSCPCQSPIDVGVGIAVWEAAVPTATLPPPPHTPSFRTEADSEREQAGQFSDRVSPDYCGTKANAL